jgi:hypothetical protein
MKSKGVVAASIRSSRGPAGGGSCALLVANTSTCRQFRRPPTRCSCNSGPCSREMITRARFFTRRWLRRPSTIQ